MFLFNFIKLTNEITILIQESTGILRFLERKTNPESKQWQMGWHFDCDHGICGDFDVIVTRQIQWSAPNRSDTAPRSVSHGFWTGHGLTIIQNKPCLRSPVTKSEVCHVSRLCRAARRYLHVPVVHSHTGLQKAPAVPASTTFIKEGIHFDSLIGKQSPSRRPNY